MNEKQKPYDLSNSLILSGVDVCNLPATLLQSYSEKISIKLEGPNTISEPPQNLYESMLRGRAVVSMDIFTNQLFGFAQLKQNSDKEWELRSLTSFTTGAARGVLFNGAAWVYNRDSDSKVIAKVRKDNAKAQRVITETGGVLIGSETSAQHFNADGLPIQKQVYDISFGTLMPKKSQESTSLDIVRESLPIDNGPYLPSHPLLSKLRWAVSSVLRWCKLK